MAVLAALALLVGGLPAAAKPADEVPAAPAAKPTAKAEVRQAVKHDRSPKLRDISGKRAGSERGSAKASVRPARSLERAAVNPSAKEGSDQVQRGFTASQVPEFTATFEGVGNVAGVLPPDTNGDVGPNHYVQMVNLHYAVYDKSGTKLLGPLPTNSLWAGFGGPCETRNMGDPVVLYDEAADRWMVTQFAVPGGSVGMHQCMAISQTGDPTGAFYRYDFLYHQTRMNDYPKYGIWPDAYYMTANEFTPSFVGAGAVAFEREKMLTGQAARMVYFHLGTEFGGLLPSDAEGQAPPPGAPNPFVMFDDDASGISPTDRLLMWDFHVDWANPANSTFGNNLAPSRFLETAPFDSNMCNYARTCIPQQGTTQRLDAISDRMMYRAAYRNFGDHASIVLNHTVDVGGDHAGVRWYELRSTTPIDWAIHQQGTYAPDAEHRWMGSAAIDVTGNIAIGYSASSSTSYPSIRVAGRLAGDPLGELGQSERTLIAGTGAQTHAAARWGDYSSMSVDPTDGCTFWFTSEYLSQTSAAGWQTRVGAMKFPNCTAGPRGEVSGKVTKADGTGIAGATVRVGGSGTVTDDQGGYKLTLSAGQHELTASAYGYASKTATVTVPDGGAVTTNFTLDTVPMRKVSGVVKDGSGHGWPLYARIDVAGKPGGPIFTDPVTGAYSADLPEGEHDLAVRAMYPSYQRAAAHVTVGDSNQVKDVNLAVATSCTAAGYTSGVNGACNPVSGGLVVGQVVDANTGTALNRATVTSADRPAEKAESGPTPDDAGLGDGFYWMFSTLTGSHPFTGASGKYESATSTVDVTADQATRADFTLKAGQLTITSPTVKSTQDVGQSRTVQTTIRNDGTAPATVELSERRGGFEILGPRGARLQNLRVKGGGLSRAWRGDNKPGQVEEPSPSAPPWTITANYPIAIMDNAMAAFDGKVYSVGGTDAAANVVNSYVYDPATNVWTRIANLPAALEKPAAAFVDGRLYVFGGWDPVGNTSPKVYVYDPNTNAWETRASTNPAPTAAAGIGVVDGQIYLVGGCANGPCDLAHGAVVRYNPGADTFTTVAAYPEAVVWQSCGGIDDTLYCAGGSVGQTDLKSTYAYDPGSNTWTRKADLPVDLWGAASDTANGLLLLSTGVINGSTTVTNQGWAYDPAADSWSALPNANHARYRAGGACGFVKVGGTTGGFTPTVDSEQLPGFDQCDTVADVPWLSASPASATLQPEQSITVNVTLDATSADVQQPGDYTAQLAIKADTPYAVAPINVTMTVQPPKDWGKATGVVTGVDCKGNSTALRGATVRINGKKGWTYTLKTDADGRYAIWAPKDNPVTINAVRDGWEPQFRLVNLKAGETIATDFALRPDTAC
ncbi:carboxypeptidase regulatory-like domain-containing protein [Micromonospora sp. DR5-3]|uniref:carboxypeptidase regulatory-like domain-containing protein n=1 Tax=unclassified Micromonospora TaxID=2617518 RepID=UPI0016524094|nr:MULTISPECIES: carboxypeptidase regulatory-like domain-containing protein [unclassified Micromonospora]MCW3817747.1 carboxypeptidase regulatory-like domain-containing protein [Micromonospora sp. DR5-3]